MDPIWNYMVGAKGQKYYVFVSKIPVYAYFALGLGLTLCQIPYMYRLGNKIVMWADGKRFDEHRVEVTGRQMWEINRQFVKDLFLDDDES